MSRVDVLRDVVASSILERAVDVSVRLTALGVPHTLIGGLAVGVHGHPRTTKDVDFLVGVEAFAATSPLLVYRDELTDLVRIGFTDLMSVPPKYPVLTSELGLDEEMRVISLRGLMLMKLDAFRPRDREDVRTLLGRDPSQIRAVRDYLAANAPDLVHRLAEVLGG
ncbi:MAG: hypothetical protein ABMA64_16855 [Myxococcota bacterium]